MALKLLRENMFYGDPKTYAYTDIAEDLPGAAKAVAPILKNVLPSAAIISSNPEERSKQIDAAIDRIKATRKSKGQLLDEMVHNVKHLTPEAMKGGALFSAAIPLLGLRLPWMRNASGKLRPQLPTAIGSNIKKLFTDPKYRNMIGKETLQGAMHSGLYTAGAGALMPLIAGNYELSDSSLQEAKRIMQEQPYLTSLPATEMMSALREHRGAGPLSWSDRAKNIAMGTGLGAATAIPGALVPAGIRALGRFGLNLARMGAKKIPTTGLASVDKFVTHQAKRFHGLPHRVKTVGSVGLRRDIPNALKWGAGLGALGGAFSKNILGDEYENLKPHQT